MKDKKLELKTAPKRKRRGLFYIVLLLLAALAGAGAFAGFEYMRKGEVALPLPESVSSALIDLLGLGPEGKIGPLRLGPPSKAGSLSEALTGAVADGAGRQTGSADPSGSANSANPARQGVSVSAGASRAEPGSANQAAQAAASGKAYIAPPDEQANDPAGGQLGTMLEGGSFQPDDAAGLAVAQNNQAGGRFATGAGGNDRAGGTDGLDGRFAGGTGGAGLAGQPGQPGQSGPADASGSYGNAQAAADNVLRLPLPESAVSAKEIAPTSLGAEPGPWRVRIYSGEDSVVTLDFVTDLANYLASGYWPRGTHPQAARQAVSTVGIKELNQRYGIDLKGFAGSNAAARDHYRDRSLILSYVFAPSMLQALTNLYADRFADSLVAAAMPGQAVAGVGQGNAAGPELEGTGFGQVDGTQAEQNATAQAGQVGATGARQAVREGARAEALNLVQTAAMLEYYAADFKALGAAFRAYAESSDAASRVEAYITAQQESYAANSRLLDAKVALEMAKESGNASGIQAAGNDVQRQEKIYAACRMREKSAEDRVLRMMSRPATSRLDASELVYTAAWIGRRGPGNAQTLRAASASLDFAAEVLAEKAEELR